MPSFAISRPHWKTASAALLAGAVLFAAGAAHADPRHHGGRGGQHYQHDRGRHAGWNRPYYPRHRSSFSLNIISTPRPVYYAQPYYVPQPVVYTPAPAPIYYHTPPVLQNDGRYCREYTRQVWVAGRMQQSYGTACLQPDGDWQVDS